MVTREVLQAEGLTVLTAASGGGGSGAVRGSDGGPEPPDLGVVATDLRMPGIWWKSGAGSASWVPDTRVVLLSAYLDDAPPEALEVADLALEKPCDLGELQPMVRG